MQYPRVPVALLTWLFLKIGFQGFGGMGSVLTLIRKEMIDQRGWITDADLNESITYTKILPGSTVMQVVAYLSYRLAGWAGAAAATVAFLVPAAIMMIVFAYLYREAAQWLDLSGALHGLSAAVAGVLLSTAYALGKPVVKSWGAAIIVLAALIAEEYVGINPVWIILLAGVIGMIQYAWSLPNEPAATAKEARRDSTA
jgi:chromate transporter